MVGLSGMLEQEFVTEMVLVETLVLGVCEGQDIVGLSGMLEHEDPVVTVIVVEPPPELEQLGDTVTVVGRPGRVLYFVVVETPRLEQVGETVETETTVAVVETPGIVRVLTLLLQVSESVFVT